MKIDDPKVHDRMRINMKKRWLLQMSPLVLILWSINSPFAEFDGSSIEPLSVDSTWYRDSLRRESTKRFNLKTGAVYRHALGMAIGMMNLGPTYKIKFHRGLSVQVTLMGWKSSNSFNVDTTDHSKYGAYYRNYTENGMAFTNIASKIFTGTLLVEKSLHRMRFGEFCAFGSIGSFYHKRFDKGYRLIPKIDTIVMYDTYYEEVDYYKYKYDTSSSLKKTLSLTMGVGASVFYLKILLEAKAFTGVSWRLDNGYHYVNAGFRLAALYRFGKISDKEDKR